MEKWDINCEKCGKFILTEEKDIEGNIRCISGSYEHGYYNGQEDTFYCSECAKELYGNK